MIDVCKARADQADPRLVAALMELTEALTPRANALGAPIHAMVKGACTGQPTTLAAIALGVMFARQILTETLSFAARSMEGDAGHEQAVMDAALAAFELTAPNMVEAQAA